MTGTGRILLIDDGTAARRSLSRALEKQGYEVEDHDAGAPALARLESGEDYDLVLTACHHHHEVTKHAAEMHHVRSSPRRRRSDWHRNCP